LFDLTIGTVGLTSAQCRENGYETRECWGTFHDRLFYYPDAVPLHVKVIFDKSNGQILGVQVVSKGQLLHVIDKASQVIQSGWTIDRLVELEHAYAPPYTQPFDPLHSMAFIADNSRSAGVDLISPLDFDTMPVDTVILDVRSPHEIETRQLETSDRRLVTIPVEELRSRIGEVPKNARIITVCQMGGRGWDAALILRRAGWSDVGILGGGALFLPVKKVD